MNVYEVITKHVIDQLEEENIPWCKPWSGSPKNFISGKDYRGINTFLLGCSGFSSPYFMTFNQAKAKGGNVKKGSKGFPVVFYKNWKEENAAGEDEKHWVMRYYRVFNADQIEGIEFPSLETGKPFEPITECEKVANGYTGPEMVTGSPQAYYSPGKDLINMPKRELFNGPEEFYSTLFHEMTHSTGHKDRLDREGIVGRHYFGDCDYSKEELIAEMGAAFLCGHTGIDNRTIENSTAYIKGWVRKFKDHPKMVLQAAAKAQKASDLILGKSQKMKIAA